MESIFTYAVTPTADDLHNKLLTYYTETVAYHNVFLRDRGRVGLVFGPTDHVIVDGKLGLCRPRVPHPFLRQ